MMFIFLSFYKLKVHCVATEVVEIIKLATEEPIDEAFLAGALGLKGPKLEEVGQGLGGIVIGGALEIVEQSTFEIEQGLYALFGVVFDHLAD